MTERNDKRDVWTKADKIYLWSMRITSLPLVVTCGCIVWDIWHRMMKGIAQQGDDLAFVVFSISGTICLVMFIASWIVRPNAE